jgi:hypothetical protein
MVSFCLRCLVLLLTIGVSAFADAERIEVGVLRMDVHISRTATLFHVVDQLSEWSYYSHRQYGRLFSPLSDADRTMLEKHKEVRAKHDWGNGLEQTFYTPISLEEALSNGITQGRLSREEADKEREVFLHFAPRIDALLAAQVASLTAFRERLRHELAQRSGLIDQFARFTGKSPDLVPVYLIPNPDPKNMGGGYNGGRLTIEVPTAADAIPTTLHELFHAFLETKKAEIEAAVAGVPGLDSETLNEGLAYALSPGIVHADSDGADPLVRTVRRQFAENKPLSDTFTRSNRYALSLRPLLQAALADERQTLSTFLPRAIDVWRGLYEVEKAREGVELRTVTITQLLRQDSPELPDFVKKGNSQQKAPTGYFVVCKEWLEGGTYRQMSEFYRRASHEILLESSGHVSVRGHLNGHTVSSGDGIFQAYGMEIDTEDQGKIVAGAQYGVHVLNNHDIYQWQVSAGFAPAILKE